MLKAAERGANGRGFPRSGDSLNDRNAVFESGPYCIDPGWFARHRSHRHGIDCFRARAIETAPVIQAPRRRHIQHMKTIQLAVVAALLIGALGVVSPAPQIATATVHIKNFAYVPPKLTVHAGERVTFVNDDDEAHTVTATDKSFDSAGMDTNDKWQHVFAKPGTYTYFCQMHPYMKGTVTVL
jgi:plastocyanin